MILSRFLRPLAAIVAFVVVSACACAPSPAPTTAVGEVTPPPSAGAFACPVQVLAGSPPTTRLVDVSVSRLGGFDRVAFIFEPGPGNKRPEDSGLIVRPVGVPPKETSSGTPLKLTSAFFVEVRFRDMSVTDAAGQPAFRGIRALRSETGLVREVVELEETSLAVDWLIGTTGRCARAWVDARSSTVFVDVGP